MEEMKPFVCSIEAGKAAKEAGLFGESPWVWRECISATGIAWEITKREKRAHSLNFPAVMLEEALDAIGEMPRVKFCDSGITAGTNWHGYPTESDEAVYLAVRIKEGQA